MLEVVVEGFCPYDVKEIYLSEGLDTHNHIRGDYFIKICDEDKTVYITDFAGSYSAGRFPRNSTTVVKNNEIVYYRENVIISSLIYSPPMGKPRKASYDRLFEEIDSAVALRCQDSPVATMSSGHDSGVIVASALHQNLSFTTLSISGNEYEDVLTKRRLLTNGMLVTEWDVNHDSHYVAAMNLDKIGCKAILSGLGADEVFTTDDYQLLSFFFQESQRYYHRLGIQTRYPLLDPEVFWQYHSLSHDLIGRYSEKRPLMEYMKSRGFPYTTEKKVAFYLN
jgi:asparagine synthetase B (glutamine-hydrolysing)